MRPRLPLLTAFIPALALVAGEPQRAFAFLGVGDGPPYPHHHARLDIDENVLPIGVRLLTAAALELMGGNTE